jgi:hypothetical protein
LKKSRRQLSEESVNEDINESIYRGAWNARAAGCDGKREKICKSEERFEAIIRCRKIPEIFPPAFASKKKREGENWAKVFFFSIDDAVKMK